MTNLVRDRVAHLLLVALRWHCMAARHLSASMAHLSECLCKATLVHSALLVLGGKGGRTHVPCSGSPRCLLGEADSCTAEIRLLWT